MPGKVKIVKAINKKRRGNPNEMNIAMDGRYNSTTDTSRKKPGQNPAQAIGLACENMTDKKYTVAVSLRNNLCWTGTWLWGKGIDVRGYGRSAIYQVFAHIETDGQICRISAKLPKLPL